jgi:chitinase
VPAGPAGDGLYQTATGGGAVGKYEAGIEDYKVLKMLGAAYKPFRHPETRAFWVFSPTDGIFWSYDDPTAIGEKTAYIKSKGGAMFWELSGDDAGGTLSRHFRRVEIDATATRFAHPPAPQLAGTSLFDAVGARQR